MYYKNYRPLAYGHDMIMKVYVNNVDHGVENECNCLRLCYIGSLVITNVAINHMTHTVIHIY